MTSSVEKELAAYDRSRLLAAAKLLNDGAVTDDIAVAYARDPDGRAVDAEKDHVGGPIEAVQSNSEASGGTGLRRHELLLILDPSLDERTVAPSIDTFLNVIRQGGGTVEKVDIWGKRRLAFEIRKNPEGIYVVVTVTATPAIVNELDRQLNLDESVLRTKITREDRSYSGSSDYHV